MFIKLKEIFLLALVIWMSNISKPLHVMTDALLMASGGGDLHPCAYHSQTFSLVE